jgi:hypothetical protein
MCQLMYQVNTRILVNDFDADVVMENNAAVLPPTICQAPDGVMP